MYKLHCVSKKLYSFYFCNNFVDSGPIWIIFDKNVANEFYNLLTLTYLLLYLTIGNQLKCCWRSRRRHVYIIMWTWVFSVEDRILKIENLCKCVKANGRRHFKHLLWLSWLVFEYFFSVFVLTLTWLYHLILVFITVNVSQICCLCYKVQ